VSPFAFFEVGFIGWIVWVSFAFNLDVSFDGSALGVVQPGFSWPSFVIAGFSEEGPVTVPAPFKVFRFEPARAFVRVPSSCPLPQTREDVAIHVSKRVFAHHVPMIVRPTANLWVELIDQIGGRHAMCSFDGSSDALEEGSNILLGRLGEQFPVGISAHVLSEEIKAVFHVGNYEFQVPIFVLTHHPSSVAPKQDEHLTLTFVTDGVESAVAQAKTAARDKAVQVVGGVSIAQQLLDGTRRRASCHARGLLNVN
jgi:hypothetical protein